MADELHLRLLGRMEINLNGMQLAGFRSNKARALLCYLAVTGHTHTRAALAGLLWADMPDTEARKNLTQTLSNLRRLVGHHLLITYRSVAFNQDVAYELDVETFAANVTGPAAHPNIARLQEAVDLYRGDFLEGFYVRDALEFEAWVLTQRARFRELALQALHSLSVYYLRQGETGYPAALDYTTRLLALEPWREEAQRQMMLLLALNGQRGAALAQYKTCKQILAEELGVEPEEETTTLYEQIRDGNLSQTGAPYFLRTGFITSPSFLRSEATRQVETPGSSFVARERELVRLGEVLKLMLAGQGCVFFVTGEPGSGKTALVQEFARNAQQDHPHLVVATGNCNAHIGVGDPYLPFREILELLTGDVEDRFAARTISQTQAQRLWRLIPTLIPTLIELGPQLMDTFVSGSNLIARAKTAVPASTPWLVQLQALLNDTAERGPVQLSQEALFSQYNRVLQRLAQQHPLLLVVDDLQWADSGSISLLFHLGRRLSHQPVMVVGVYRPSDLAVGQDGERHPLEAVINEFQREFGQIPINLDRAEGRDFVESFLETEPNRLGAVFREALYHQTHGHALFTIEILRGLQERGDLVQDEAGRWIEGATIDWETLPVRVEGIIKERIARLPVTLQETLKIASLEGEKFTAEAVARVQALDERQMISRLSERLDRQHRLVQSHSTQQTAPGSQRLSGYRFRHHLFQRYLYNSLAQAERVYLHEAVGQALEELYSSQPEMIALQLARHFQAAGMVDKSIFYLHQAGERAGHFAAYQEAIVHFNQALSLLNTLPETPERIQQELALQVALSTPLMKIKGISSPDVKQVLDRARVLCVQAGAAPQIFPVWQGLYWLYLLRAELDTTTEVTEQLLRLVKQQKDPLFFLPVRLSAGTLCLFNGELAQARHHLERCFALDDPRQHQTQLRRFGQNPMVSCLTNIALNLWYLGFPDQALKQSFKAVKLAQESSHAYDQAYTLYCASWTHQLRREAQATQTQAEAAIELSTRHSFAYWLSMATILRGWALVEQGRTEEGITQMRQGLVDLETIGARLLRPYFLALLGQSCEKIGQIDEGLALLTEALALVNSNKERHYEAELYRLKGELLLRTKAKAEAEHHFRQAVEIARKQQAKSLELRAIRSLGRLLRQQTNPVEARQMLAEIYGWFSEGFDIADIKEAKTLLEELA